MLVQRVYQKSHGSSDAGNFIRFYCRKATGALVNVFNINGNKDIHCYGTITTAAGFVSTSDQSVKDDVKDIDLTPIFGNCNVKSYNRTDKPESGKRIGFIAQDIQKACTDNNLPNAFNNEIKQEDDTTLLGLDCTPDGCASNELDLDLTEVVEGHATDVCVCNLISLLRISCPVGSRRSEQKQAKQSD